MMKITGLSHLFKWENLHNWWLTKYFFAPLYVMLNYHRACVRGEFHAHCDIMYTIQKFRLNNFSF